MSTAGPRILGPKSDLPPAVLFTDGACEEEVSIGGVLFIPGEAPEVWGCVLAREDVEEWKSKSSQAQVIGQAEIFPVLVAKLTWKDKLAGRRVICFLDNESAKIALIRSYSPVVASLRIVMEVSAWDYSNQCSSWYSRVPTCCNVADDPSCMLISEYLQSLGAKIVKPVLPNGKAPAKVLK